MTCQCPVVLSIVVVLPVLLDGSEVAGGCCVLRGLTLGEDFFGACGGVYN